MKILENHDSQNDFLDRTQSTEEGGWSSGNSNVAGTGGTGTRAKVIRPIEDYGKYAGIYSGALRQQGRGRFSFKESSEKVSFSPFPLFYFGYVCSSVWCPYFIALTFCYAGPTLTWG